MKLLLAIFLACLPLLAGDTVYHLLVVAEPQVQAIRQEFLDGGLKLPGGLANLAVPLYRTIETNQTTIVARWTCLAESQVTPAMKTRITQLLGSLPANSFRHYKFTNQVNTAQVLTQLGLATKISTPLLVNP